VDDAQQDVEAYGLAVLDAMDRADGYVRDQRKRDLIEALAASLLANPSAELLGGDVGT
jgi:hypothetical protein